MFEISAINRWLVVKKITLCIIYYNIFRYIFSPHCDDFVYIYIHTHISAIFYRAQTPRKSFPKRISHLRVNPINLAIYTHMCARGRERRIFTFRLARHTNVYCVYVCYGHVYSTVCKNVSDLRITCARVCACVKVRFSRDRTRYRFVIIIIISYRTARDERIEEHSEFVKIMSITDGAIRKSSSDYENSYVFESLIYRRGE